MAFSAHKSEEEIREIYDDKDQLDCKIDELVSLIKESNHFVVFTGAGVSTSAGIPDFRGPEGVWTLQAQGRPRLSPTTSTIEAFPTPTHMSLVGLQNKGILKYLISQNCDGLHRRSGILPSMISELHGNGNVEECQDCGLQYFRDFGCYRIGHGHDHFTGRFCHSCGGRLLEWTIDFGQNLPERPLILAEKHSKKADLCLALGSSLTVSPACNMPKYTAKYTSDRKKIPGKLCIVNLQKTPLDKYASLRIFHKTDVVMQEVMRRLNVLIPEFELARRAEFRWEDSTLRLYGWEPHINVSADIFSAVEIHSHREWKKMQKSVSDKFEVHEHTLDDVDVNEYATIVFHFMGHYKEPPLEITSRLGRDCMFRMTYFPLVMNWSIFPLDDLSPITWTQVSMNNEPPPPSMWNSASCVLLNGSPHLVITGGTPTHMDCIASTFTFSNAKWNRGITSQPQLPLGSPFISAPRWGHSSVSLNSVPDSVFLFGGWDSSATFSDLHLLNCSTGDVKEIKSDFDSYWPSPRAGHACIALSDQDFMIFGGAVCKKGQYHFFNDILVFNSQNGVWTKREAIGDIPSVRAQHSLLQINDDTLLCIGGWNGSDLLFDVYILELDSFKWHRLEMENEPPINSFDSSAEMPEYRVFPARSVPIYLGQGIAMIHGIFGSMMLSIREKRWWRPSLEGPYRLCSGSCLLPDGSVAMFGGRDEEKDRNSLHILSPSHPHSYPM